MEITQDLLDKWEPKVHRMLKTCALVGIEYEDAAQELRIEIVKAAKAFDENRGASFHTFLHTCMINRVRQLIGDAQKKKNDNHAALQPDLYPWILVEQNEDNEPRLEIRKHSDVYDYEITEAFQTLGLTSAEAMLFDLFLCGYKKRHVRGVVQNKKSFDKIWGTMRRKVKTQDDDEE